MDSIIRIKRSALSTGAPNICLAKRQCTEKNQMSFIYLGTTHTLDAEIPPSIAQQIRSNQAAVSATADARLSSAVSGATRTIHARCRPNSEPVYYRPLKRSRTHDQRFDIVDMVACVAANGNASDTCRSSVESGRLTDEPHEATGAVEQDGDVLSSTPQSTITCNRVPLLVTSTARAGTDCLPPPGIDTAVSTPSSCLYDLFLCDRTVECLHDIELLSCGDTFCCEHTEGASSDDFSSDDSENSNAENHPHNDYPDESSTSTSSECRSDYDDYLDDITGRMGNILGTSSSHVSSDDEDEYLHGSCGCSDHSHSECSSTEYYSQY